MYSEISSEELAKVEFTYKKYKVYKQYTEGSPDIKQR